MWPYPTATVARPANATFEHAARALTCSEVVPELGEGVPVALEEPVPVALEEPVPVALDEPVPVALDEGVPDGRAASPATSLAVKLRLKM